MQTSARFILPILLLALATAHGHACALGWSRTIAEALTDAQRSQRLAVIVFTGSDWSVRSLKLDQEVLMNPEFADLFMKHFALANADFPQRQPPAPEVLAENTTVATKFKIKSWPTLLALRPDGTEFARFEYGEQSTREVTDHVEEWQIRFAREAAAGRAPEVVSQ